MRRCSAPASLIVSSLPVIAARPMNEPTSMWSGPMRYRAAVQPVDRRRSISVLVPMPSIRAPRVHQEPGQVLHVGLAGGVQHAPCCPGARTAAIIAFSVAVTLASSRKISAPRRPAAQPVLRVDHAVGAQAAEGQQVRVDAPPPDDVAAGERQLHLAAAREQRPGQQQRRPQAAAEVGVELGGAHAVGAQGERVGALVAHADAEVVEEREHHVHVEDVGHVLEHDLLVGEQAGGQDRQGRVLVAARDDRAGEGAAAPDDQPVLTHVGGR